MTTKSEYQYLGNMKKSTERGVNDKKENKQNPKQSTRECRQPMANN